MAWVSLSNRSPRTFLNWCKENYWVDDKVKDIAQKLQWSECCPEL